MAEQMTNRESAEEWLSFAKMDRDSAEFLLAMRPLPTEVICFHCQQSAEKCLKSILILHGVFPPKTHDLMELKELCTPYIHTGDAIDRQCNQLNRYSVRARYPRQIEITEEQLAQAVEDAKTILHYTLSLFPSPVGNGEGKI